MEKQSRLSVARYVLLLLATGLPWAVSAANSTVLGWNNLGMHCMDSDYSVFSILPPYNTVEAQLIVGGLLVTNGAGYTVTYQAVADPDGSFDSTAMGKGNFYTYAAALYGVPLAPEAGLAGWSMPGVSNTPQTMLFEVTNQPAAGVATPANWWRAEGIPLSPYDDAHRKNPYPLMRLIAWNSARQPIATNDVVLPISDEMDCRACHASGTGDAAQPVAGWVWDGLPERDYRLNILRLHDERQFALSPALYAAALTARGFNPAGLYRGVTADGKPVLCAACHASEALGAPSFGTIPALTASVHGYHAHVLDPDLQVTLDAAANRAACYRCHPGSTTRCLRGAMGGAIAADGSMAMQCQSCHGTMSAVGATNRVGWFMEPACQSCHTGTATSNNGQIRYTTALDTNGSPRVAVNPTFATQPNTPAAGLSLYRFSAGHGGLQCSACHGSTHAEFPSTHRNDNLRNLALQGHVGVMVECTACHVTMPANAASMSGGPHGMHPISQDWVNTHHDLVGGNRAQCQACHGTDYRGTVLSRAQADRVFTLGSDQGSTQVTLFRGALVGCYTCHLGPSEGDANPSAAPTVANVTTNTTNDKAVALTLPATGSGLTVRIISQPANGSVGLNTNTGVATYFPTPGFVGSDTFTFAAYDGAKNSNLGTGTVAVTQGPSGISAQPQVPPSYPAAWPVPFGVVATLSNLTGSIIFNWDFGDGSAHGTDQFAAHTYALPGSYTWTVTSTFQGSISSATTSNNGTIVIGSPVRLSAAASGGSVTVSWPQTVADTLLEGTSELGPAAHWQWLTNTVDSGLGSSSVTLPGTAGNEFLRLRRPW